MFRERAKEAFAFSLGFGFPQYTWNVMPHGVKTAGNCFQRTMSTFLGSENEMLPPFYDDIVIKGSTFSEHLKNEDLVLLKTRKAVFTLNAMECIFFQTKLPYLGHIINNGTISLDPKCINVIKEFPMTKNLKELRRFIGMAQFCCRFVKNLNVILSPLYNLTKANTVYNWSSECESTFDQIKTLLTEAPILRSPSDTSNLILETDASDIGIGSCLKIANDNGEEFVVGYDSSKFTDTELK